MPARPSEYHKNDDVVKSMPDVSFVASTEIRDWGGKIHQPFQNTALRNEFIYYFAVWLSLCASIERLWSSGSIFNVTVWYSPIKLLKIYHLTKFLTTYFQENKWLSSLHPNCPRYKITHFSTMRRNLKWKNRVFSINDSVKIAEVVET